MRRATKQHILKNEKGLAMIETIPLMIIFVVLVSSGLGLFGVIHTATLHSIGARTYSYETFRQRTNLTYFRENESGLSRPFTFGKRQWRFQGVQNESDSRNNFVATARPISFGRNAAMEDMSIQTHNQTIFDLPARNDRIAVSPAWIMVGYGICLHANCGN